MKETTTNCQACGQNPGTEDNHLVAKSATRSLDESIQQRPPQDYSVAQSVTKFSERTLQKSLQALLHEGFQPCEQSFLRVNQKNSPSWQVGKSPTELHKQQDLSTFSFVFFMEVYVKLVNHSVHGVKLVNYQLANCVSSFCLRVKM